MIIKYAINNPKAKEFSAFAVAEKNWVCIDRVSRFTLGETVIDGKIQKTLDIEREPEGMCLHIRDVVYIMNDDGKTIEVFYPLAGSEDKKD